MTGTLLLDPPERAARTRACASTLDDGDGCCSSTRAASAPASSRSAREALDAFFAARLGVEPFEPRVHRRAPARARARAPRADQGVPARPEADRRRRQHLRRRGAVPRPHPPAAAGGPAHARAGRGAARRGRRVARGRASTPRARRSTTSATPTASAARSRTASWSTCARASRACAAGAPVRKLRAAGRGTYVCERCQPRPRRRRCCSAAARQLRRAGERPSRSASSSSRKPPSGSPSTTIWGNVIMPVRRTSSARPSGSLARLISS